MPTHPPGGRRGPRGTRLPEGPPGDDDRLPVELAGERMHRCTNVVVLTVAALVGPGRSPDAAEVEPQRGDAGTRHGLEQGLDQRDVHRPPYWG